MAIYYTFDYNQIFYNEITKILKSFDIEIDETISSDHMYGLQDYVTNDTVVFELNKKLGNIYISYYNPSINNLWDETITRLIIEQLQKIIRINHSNKSKLRESIERCLVS